MSGPNNPAHIELFSGFAGAYDRYRPQPPRVLLDILTQLAEMPRPRRVVDIGSGTGLSTRLWAERADEVIGVEPNADMRTQAEAATGAAYPNVHYRAGYSTDTGLAGACADIVTVSQALHWMPPAPTFAEVARILRPGGVFAAYDCDWPPVMNWEAQAAFAQADSKADQVAEAHGLFRDVEHLDKEGHLARIAASGRFRYVQEILVHNVESGNAERLVELVKTQGSIAQMRRLGYTDLGLDELAVTAQRTLGDEPRPWYFCYRVRLGIK